LPEPSPDDWHESDELFDSPVFERFDLLDEDAFGTETVVAGSLK